MAQDFVSAPVSPQSEAADSTFSEDAARTLRLIDAERRELARLQVFFRGAVRVQLKPLVHAIGVSERSVRNHKNILRINGVEVLPALVQGSITYDLEAVARALALADVQPPPPARVVAANLAKVKAKTEPVREATKAKGRAKKTDLAEQIGGAA